MSDHGHLSFNFSEAPHQHFQLIANSTATQPEKANAKLKDLLIYMHGGQAPKWWNKSQIHMKEGGRSINLDDEHYVMRCPLLSINEETEKWESDHSILLFANKFMQRMAQDV